MNDIVVSMQVCTPDGDRYVVVRVVPGAFEVGMLGGFPLSDGSDVYHTYNKYVAVQVAADEAKRLVK